MVVRRVLQLRPGQAVGRGLAGVVGVVARVEVDRPRPPAGPPLGRQARVDGERLAGVDADDGERRVGRRRQGGALRVGHVVAVRVGRVDGPHPARARHRRLRRHGDQGRRRRALRRWLGARGGQAGRRQAGGEGWGGPGGGPGSVRLRATGGDEEQDEERQHLQRGRPSSRRSRSAAMGQDGILSSILAPARRQRERMIGGPGGPSATWPGASG